MKTEYEIEQIKKEITERMKIVQDKAEEAWNSKKTSDYVHYDREYAKLVAQYNILCEVLQ